MSNRVTIAELPTPHPIAERLPAVYLDSEFTVDFTRAFDAVLAPVLLTLDSFAAYLDPRLAPEDFVAWLADWVAFPIDESWSATQRRELVAQAVQLHRWRGTKLGLERHVVLLTGGDVDVEDSGGCTWSERAGAALPEEGPPWVRVVVRVADPAAVDERRLLAAVAELVPAHVRATVTVTQAIDPGPGTPAEGEGLAWRS
jgi:phage tail-like protein